MNLSRGCVRLGVVSAVLTTALTAFRGLLDKDGLLLVVSPLLGLSTWLAFCGLGWALEGFLPDSQPRHSRNPLVRFLRACNDDWVYVAMVLLGGGVVLVRLMRAGVL